ncbi:MAG: hypothetical protein P8Z30_14140 [Acidobacteriota bacterium]
MSRKVSRRTALKTMGGAGVGLLAASPGIGASAPPILPLNSTSGVFIPPRGRSFMKFSFDFPEPSVRFENLLISFRLYTFENTYGRDIDRLTAEEKADALEINCSQFVWAGNQERAPGKLQARIRKNGSFIEWDVNATMGKPIKSIATIVRGVPRGEVSPGASGFFDPKDNELLFGYPFGGGDLFIARQIDTPLVIVRPDKQSYYFLSVLGDRVRANRFYFQPGEKGYRVEIVFERPGWERESRIQSPVWRAGQASSMEGAIRPHYEHLERAFGIPDWETRKDVPAWFRKIALVVSLHGMHWTGYIFNDYAKMLKILRWIATKIPGDRVLVFLPAWDGRYYWNYPLYEPDKRLGGAQGLESLIHQGHGMGFHFVPMFGANSANDLLPVYPRFSDATTAEVDRNPFYLDWVDWDNDRHMEGWMPWMNLGVASWRQWLAGRISDFIQRFRVDAYFLDIAGGWVNNTKADMFEGTRELVKELSQKFPGILACGEMYYDALMSIIPVFQVFSDRAYPQATLKYIRAYEHLSRPAPGRGSSGVHESGFHDFNPKTLGLTQHQIPTITVVDDTFDRYRNVMAQIIQRARQRAGIG